MTDVITSILTDSSARSDTATEKKLLSAQPVDPDGAWEN